jgi:hypothetical protein
MGDDDVVMVAEGFEDRLVGLAGPRLPLPPAPPWVILDDRWVDVDPSMYVMVVSVMVSTLPSL